MTLDRLDTEILNLLQDSASMARHLRFTREVFSSNNKVRHFKSTFAMNCSKFETRIRLAPPAGMDGGT